MGSVPAVVVRSNFGVPVTIRIYGTGRVNTYYGYVNCEFCDGQGYIYEWEEMIRRKR